MEFDQALGSIIMAADGTWTSNCRVDDISASGAKLKIFGHLNARMRTEEFFLLMTADGKVKRRAKLVWENSSELGVQFIRAKER